MKINNKDITLGHHKFFIDAVIARHKAEVKYKYKNCQTTPAAFLYLKEIGLL